MQASKENEIYVAIKNAIIHQKLRPGMQLVEDDIAESFGVSRTPIRNVFRRLALENLVSVVPFKGTYVSCPTINEAKQVFEARRALEIAAIRELCRNVTEDQLRPLQDILLAEQEAHQNNDAFGVIRSTGEFHVMLARLTGNSFIAKYLEELVSITYVIIAFYGQKRHTSCHDHEHILEVIASGDEHKAVKMLEDHLIEIEQSLDFQLHNEPLSSLSEIFKGSVAHSL